MSNLSEGSGSVIPAISVKVTSVKRPTSLDHIPTAISSSSQVLDTPTITNILFSALDGVQSGVPTRTTPTVTPTTLKNIEELFEAPAEHLNQAGFVPPPVQISSGVCPSETTVDATSSSNTISTVSTTIVSVNNKGWGGGVITLTQPSTQVVSSSQQSIPVMKSDFSSTLSTSNTPSVSTRGLRRSTIGTRNTSMPIIKSVPPSAGTRRTGGRRPQRDNSLSPEEEERREVRRERNKQAAARCRKRRLDLTMQLQEETDALESRRDDLQQEIILLKHQREELEFLLSTHQNVCKKIRQQDQENDDPHSSILIKEEPLDFDHYGEPIIPSTTTSYLHSTKSKVVGLQSSNGGASSNSKPSRPTSLSLESRSISDLGVPIETPSSGLRGLGLNFDSMMEGGTGLTPVTPSSLQLITPLSTPVASTSSSNTNCSSQLRFSSSDLASPDSLPPKLVSL